MGPRTSTGTGLPEHTHSCESRATRARYQASTVRSGPRTEIRDLSPRTSLTLQDEAGIHLGLREVRLIPAGALGHQAQAERDRRPGVNENVPKVSLPQPPRPPSTQANSVSAFAGWVPLTRRRCPLRPPARGPVGEDLGREDGRVGDGLVALLAGLGGRQTIAQTIDRRACRRQARSAAAENGAATAKNTAPDRADPRHLAQGSADEALTHIV